MLQSSPGILNVKPSLEARRQAIVRDLDRRMSERANTVVGTLRTTHQARLSRWQFPLRDNGGVLIRYTAQEFARLDPLAKHVERVRAEAEARLVHEQLGFLLLSDSEREEHLQRAIGILPATEDERYNEICAHYDLCPKHIMVDTSHFATGVRSIETSYGLATALGYSLLLAAGVRTREEMLSFGARFQRLFDRLMSAGAVVQTILRVAETSLRRASFDTQFTLLTQIREARKTVFPSPNGNEFRITRLLEAPDEAEVVNRPNALGLAALDAVILARLMFRPRLVLTADGYIGLEIQFDARSIYWDLSGTTPLSHVPIVPAGRKADIYELLPMNYFQIGIWSSRQGQLTRAASAFGQSLVLKPNMPEAWNELAQVHLRANRPEDAVKAGRQAVALNPSFAEAYITLASGLLTLNRPDEALEVLSAVLKVKPDMPEAYNNLGFARQMKGEAARALEAFRSAVRIRPDYVSAWYNMGNSLVALADLEEAIVAYHKAVKLNPHHARAFYNLGQTYYQLKKLDSALDAYEKVLKINPKHAGALYNMGIIYRDKGMTEKAVETIEQAVRLNPNLLR